MSMYIAALERRMLKLQSQWSRIERWGEVHMRMSHVSSAPNAARIRHVTGRTQTLRPSTASCQDRICGWNVSPFLWVQIRLWSLKKTLFRKKKSKYNGFYLEFKYNAAPWAIQSSRRYLLNILPERGNAQVGGPGAEEAYLWTCCKHCKTNMNLNMTNSNGYV